ncbi:condensation domain-containing protein [Vibrio sp. PP-XX7]
MDVTQAPLINAYAAFDEKNARWVLCLLHHHLCMDHTTLELMIEEIQAHLSGKADQLPAPLPFRNFVAHIRLKADIPAQKNYFSARLSDIDEPSAPFGLFATRHNSQQIESHHTDVPDDISNALRNHARQLGVSTASLFHLAWGLVVRTTTGRDDVVFGTVLFGRMAGGEGADRVMGMFLIHCRCVCHSRRSI